jgi:hypothetical protein
MKYFVLDETHNEQIADVFDSQEEAEVVALQNSALYSGSTFTVCCKLESYNTTVS